MALTRLKLKISNLDGIESYAFEFNGRSLDVNDHEREFEAEAGQEGILFWWMRGDSGGSMKVEVFQGDEILRKRENSRIPNTRALGHDSLVLKPKKEL